MGHPRMQIIALVGAGAISSSAIFCFLLVYFLPDPAIDEPGVVEIQPAAPNPAPGADTVAPVMLAKAEDDGLGHAKRALHDDSLPLLARREAAFVLAQIGTDDALMELLLAASSGSPFLKAIIAEALQNFSHPEAQRFLEALLKDSEEMVARAAVRSMVALGDEVALARVAEVLFNPNKPESVRTEAALALGRSDHPDALQLLLHATYAAEDSDDLEPIFHHVLQALAERSFGEVEGFLANYLSAVQLHGEARAAVLEALAGGTEGTAAFLVNFLRDADPEVRSAAAWSLSITPDAVNHAAKIMDCLRTEREAEVRASLYRTLHGQTAVDVEAFLPVIQAEQNRAAQLAGFDLLASWISSGGSPAAVDYFNARAVPALHQEALDGSDLYSSLSAIVALRRARTADAQAALADIARNSTNPRVSHAATAATRQTKLQPLATVE